MQRFRLWLNENSYHDLVKQFHQDMAPKLLANPVVQKELQDTGRITIKTLMQQGLPEGDANLASRELTKNYGNEATANAHWRLQMPKTQDDYLYHVTLKTRLPAIKRNGIKPGSNPVFSNYSDYSSGKTFLSELGGVNFWKMRVEQHEEANTDNPKGVVVLRIPKDAVKDLRHDKAGTDDSRHPSYTTTNIIPPNVIQVV